MAKGDSLFIVRSEEESGSLTADANVDLQCKADAIGCILLLDVDTLTGSSPTLDIKVQGLIPSAAKGSAVYADIPGCSFPQLTTSNDDTQHTLTIYPGVAETSNISVSQTLPQKIRIVLDTGGSSPVCPVTIVGYWQS